MPFGIRRPLEYIRAGRTVIHPESYDSCPICKKPIDKTADGLTPVAPCLFPHVKLPDYELTVILGCSACYQAQKRLMYNSVQELELYRLTKSVKLDPEPKAKKPVGRPPKESSGLASRSYSHDELSSMLVMYEIMGEVLRSNGLLKTSTDIVAVNMSRSVSNQGLPDDDIEFGMTPEQRAAMDQAVHDASERTKLVPSESWNGRTAAEILADTDENGVPNGW